MQQQGGSRYGVPPPEMAAPFSSGSQATQQQQPPPPPRTVRIPPGIEYLQQQQAAPEAASPISSRPPPPPPGSIFEEYGAGAGAVGGGFPDEEALGAGEEAERAGGVGNRWPRQETLALLKIRSDMDAAFRDATLKGPLWDDVSRKLAELGYARSAKKCKEKFENVHKYYKRTKEGRAGRQDGKSYRFFSQLEAIQSYTGGGGGAQVIAALSPLPQNTASFPVVISSALVSSGISPPQVNVSSSSLSSPGSMMKTVTGLRIQPPGFSSMGAIPVEAPAPALATAAGISFSSNTSSSSASDTDGDETEEGVAGAMQDDGRKRKREGWPSGGSRKMMAFFDGLMKQVMERQELMQQRFFETIEKREQDRMIREEAWKRQEMARLNREYELMAQERAVAANRDAAVISFLEKFTGFPANQPPAADPTISAVTPPQPSPASVPPPPCSPKHQQQQPKPPAPVEIQLNPLAIEFDDDNNNERNQLSASSEPPSTAAAISEAAEAMGGGGAGCLDAISPSLSSSRWPKPEVLALIKLRSGLETKYLEAGPKGPLWEEISLGMKVLGYSRNSKRCKEKWENINKYFKKVKESNKKRPEDAKTCPYFHELDALYRKKQLNIGGGGSAAAATGIVTEPQQEQIREPLRTLEPISAPTEQENSNGQNKSAPGNHETGGDQIHRNNGATGIPQVFFGGAPSRVGAAALKKPEDIIRQLMEQQNQRRPGVAGYSKLSGPADSDTINPEYEEEDEDYDDEDEENGKLRYEIQFQRQAAGSGPAGNATGKVAPAASPAGSFLAMVQ